MLERMHHFITAEEIYAKNPELKKENVKLLREWMESQPHLPQIQDAQLLIFYHSCYLDMKKTKRCIENFYTFRTNTPYFFADRNISSESLQFQLKVSLVTLLPETTPDDCLVLYIRLIDIVPKHFDYSEQVKMVDMAIQLALMQYGPKPGFVAVFDMEGTSFAHIFRINPITSKKFVDYVQEALPVRLKSIHLINVNGFTAHFINLLRPFMAKHLSDVINIHRSLETLYEEIPKEILPNEVGGDCGTVDELHEAQLRNIEENADYFLEDELLKADDSKRPTERSNGLYNKIFG